MKQESNTSDLETSSQVTIEHIWPGGYNDPPLLSIKEGVFKQRASWEQESLSSLYVYMFRETVRLNVIWLFSLQRWHPSFPGWKSYFTGEYLSFHMPSTNTKSWAKKNSAWEISCIMSSVSLEDLRLHSQWYIYDFLHKRKCLNQFLIPLCLNDKQLKSL